MYLMLLSLWTLTSIKGRTVLLVFVIVFPVITTVSGTEKIPINMG